MKNHQKSPTQNAHTLCCGIMDNSSVIFTHCQSPTYENHREYHCEKCNYKCSRNSELLRHYSTRKHQLLYENHQNHQNYHCETCDYKCSRNSELLRHYSTRKHQILTENHRKITAHDSSNVFVCKCGKEYLCNTSLYRHRKTCDVYLENSTGRVSDNSANVVIQGIPPEIVLKIITENAKLQQDFMIKQSEMMTEFIKNNSGSIVSANNSHNTTNSHNKFNLNFFLNEQCKNAMNITDFANNIQIGIDDLENVGRTGYVKGITDIIVKNLNGMDVHDRPIHCTDLKRETLYIRDDDKWDKENPDKTKLKKCIKTIANKNEAKISDWCTENPQCMTNNHPSNEFYLSMYKNVLGGVGRDQQDKYDNTIIKNVSKSIIVEKADN